MSSQEPQTNLPIPPQMPSGPVFSPGAALATPGALPSGVAVADPWIRFGSYILEGVLAFVTLGIGWLIWATMIAGTGQTPAKKVLKLRVIDANTSRPASFGKMFWVRGLVAGWVANLAIMFTLGILLFMPFWDKRRQNLWDKVSNTFVVNDPNDAWATRPDIR